jgi:hypothetical protein
MEVSMTPEQEQRIKQLSVLIASEPDTEKMVTLAAELEKLLTLRLVETKSRIRKATRAFAPKLPL